MFIKKLGIEVNEENFAPEYKEKNMQFFKGLDNDDAVVYYATAEFQSLIGKLKTSLMVHMTTRWTPVSIPYR